MNDVFLFEGFRFDRSGTGLGRRDANGHFVPVAIGSRALDILGVLLERPGELVSRDEIMTAVWPRTVVEDSNLTVHISALRRVLDQGRSQGSCIQTVAARGYRFVGEVTRQAKSASGAAPGGATDTSANPRSFRRTISSLILRPRRRRLWVSAAAMVIVLSGLVVSRTEGWWHGAGTDPADLSFVVLPFANLSNDPDQDYFVDAITDDLTTDLSRLPGSFVIARGTAFTFKGKPV